MGKIKKDREGNPFRPEDLSQGDGSGIGGDRAPAEQGRCFVLGIFLSKAFPRNERCGDQEDS